MQRRVTRFALVIGLIATLSSATIAGAILLFPRASQAQNNALVSSAPQDLGSLDGQGSSASDINDSGQIVGFSTTVSGPPRPFVWQNGAMSALPTPPGDAFGGASGNNNLGQIVGSISDTTGVPTLPVLWPSASAAPIVLRTLPASTSSIATAINDKGQIVGYAQFSFDTFHAVLWRSANAAPVDLGTLPGGSNSVATAINSQGQIVGISNSSIGSSSTSAARAVAAFSRSFSNLRPFAGIGATRPVLWRSAGSPPVDLGTLGGSNGTAGGINDSGQIVGSSTLSGDAVEHVTLWQNGRITDLGSSGGPFTAGAAINNQGQIVGWGTGSPGGSFLLQNGTFTHLDGLSAGVGSQAFAINNHTQIVGLSGTGGPADAVLWAPPRGRLVIFVHGISTGLASDQIGNGDFTDFNTMVEYLLSHGWAGATFLNYSYKGSTNQGIPKPYDCLDTFRSSISDDVQALHTQITSYLTTHPNTDVYLIGHSLGGVIAYGELAKLQSQGWSLPNGGQLHGVITLDSPIGGVSNNRAYLQFVVLAFNFTCDKVKNLGSLTSVADLMTIFGTAPNSHPQGGQASVKVGLFGGALVTNQQLAEDAYAHGIPVLTIGNVNDLLWDPSLCLVDGDFRTTQWVTDEAGSTLAIYGRDFTQGPLVCGTPAQIENSHSAVLSNTDVELGVTGFLANGGVPLPLAVAPSSL